MTRAGQPVALGPMRVRLSHAEASGLASLLGEILCLDLGPDKVPHIAAMRLLADVASASNVDFGVAGQGLAVVQEAQTIRTPSPIVVGQELSAAGSFVAMTGEAATLSLTLRDDSGGTVCVLQTRLRLGEPGAMARSRVPRAPAASPSGSEVRSLPITAKHVVGYAALSGDRNPLHLDLGLAEAAGLPERVVHGMLLVGLAEAAIDGRWPGGRLAETRTRFVAPAFVGETATLDISERGRSPDGARLVRVSVVTETGQIACIVDAVVGLA